MQMSYYGSRYTNQTRSNFKYETVLYYARDDRLILAMNRKGDLQ